MPNWTKLADGAGYVDLDKMQALWVWEANSSPETWRIKAAEVPNTAPEFVLDGDYATQGEADDALDALVGA